MSEYVDREKLIKAIEKDACELVFYCKEEAVSCVEAAPAEDVRPVVRGHWEIVTGSNGKEYMVCSECRVQQDLSALFTYCPNCGALMVWEEESET